MAFLKAARPKARLLFSLDNEPDLWSHTHAELFPSKVTYADLWRRNHDFAAAAKAVWPEAPILGVVSYGYNGFLTLQDAADAAGRPFLEWYLDQARAAEQAEGRRLIDYLDVHWYPEATAEGQRVVSDAVIPAVIEAREQAPRSLWDRGYQEASWIRDKAGGPLNLIPWLQAKIAGHYPGTKLAFSEWNYGGGKHVSGAIAVCDVLGVFGRSGVDLATYWPMSNSEEFALAAFRVFRNFDGAGAHFGDTSVSAGSSDVATATVYASIDRANPMRMVIVAINKAPVARNAGVQIAHPAVFLHARTFVLTGASTNIQAGPALEPVATNAFMYPMPPQSVSIILPEE